MLAANIDHISDSIMTARPPSGSWSEDWLCLGRVDGWRAQG